MSGKARSGKNTFGNFLMEEFKKQNLNVKQEAFADGVKNGSKADFKPLTDFLNEFVEHIKAQIGPMLSFNKNAPVDTYMKVEELLNQLKTKDENWFEEKTPVTRLILQAYGTEIFRKRVDMDWWAKLLKDKFLKSDADITIVTDCRFPNEIEVFNDAQDYRVITIKIERKVPTASVVAAHDSETALDNWTAWNYIIDNNNISMEELRESAITVAKDILAKEPKYEKDSYLFDDDYKFSAICQSR